MPAQTPRNRYLVRTYGITEADYEAMLAGQGGTCSICHRPPKSRRLHVDHNHRSGRVRGLLCFRCNSALPTRITREWLESAARYLKAAGE